MKTTYFKYTNVNPDGTFGDGKLGAIGTKSTITKSSEKGGCGLETCGCSEGHWICVSKGRNDEGIVEGKTIHFKNKKEMKEFLKDIDAISNLRIDW